MIESNSPSKVYPSVFLFLLIASSFILSLVQLENYDIWLHLKTGEGIIDNLRVPFTQLFSYSIGEVPWISHSWFFLVLNSIIYKFLGGVNGLILFRAITVVGILYIALKGYLYKVYNPLFLLVSWLVATILLARIPIRPELISSLFLAIYLYALFHKNDLRILIPIQLFWVNMHGYYVLGPMLLLLCIVSEIIKDKVKLPFDWNEVTLFKNRSSYKNAFKVLAIIILLSLASPYFVNNLKYPFFALKSFIGSSSNFYRVSELSSLNLSDILFTQKNLWVSGAIFLFVLSVLVNLRRISFFNISVFTIFFLMYLAAKRHNSFFAVAAAFCILENFRGINLGHLKNCFKSRYFKILSIVLTILVSFFIIRDLSFRVRAMHKKYMYSDDLSSKSSMFGINRSKYPQRGVDFIVKNNINGPIFNSFNLGGYLAFRLYPAQKVFIDGRTEVYGNSFMDKYVHSISEVTKWHDLDKEYGFNTVILDYATSGVYHHLIQELYDSPQWKLVYFGDIAVIFLKDNLVNKRVFSLYNVTLEDIGRDEADNFFIEDKKRPVYPGYFLNRARFFINIQMPLSALKDLERSELISPGCYEVYQLRGYIYFKMKMFNEARKAFNRSLEINSTITEPYLNLGSTAAEMGLYKDAYAFYKKTLQIDKNNKTAIDNINKLPKWKSNSGGILE